MRGTAQAGTHWSWICRGSSYPHGYRRAPWKRFRRHLKCAVVLVEACLRNSDQRCYGGSNRFFHRHRSGASYLGIVFDESKTKFKIIFFIILAHMAYNFDDFDIIWCFRKYLCQDEIFDRIVSATSSLWPIEKLMECKFIQSSRETPHINTWSTNISM